MALNLRPYPISKDPREIRDWFFRIFEMLTRTDSVPWRVVDKDEDFEEEIEDVVGAMVSGNSEIGIAVTYDDPNGKLDFTLEFNTLTADTIAGADVLAFFDDTGSDHNNITFANFESTLNHDNLAGFVADEHVPHSTVILTAGVGLSGGGNIAASRTFDLDINELSVDTISAGDFIAFFDIDGPDHNKITFANFESTLDHDNLFGFVADEHVAHSGVVLTAGVGLTGGGDITVSRTFDLDINGLVTDTIAAADTLAFFDDDGVDHNKITFANFESTLNHDNLFGFVADEHVAHSSVILTAGVGLSGGGDITVNRTFDLDIDELAADTIADDDTLAFFDDDGADHNKITFANLEATLTHDNLANNVEFRRNFLLMGAA